MSQRGHHGHGKPIIISLLQLFAGILSVSILTVVFITREVLSVSSRSYMSMYYNQQCEPLTHNRTDILCRLKGDDRTRLLRKTFLDFCGEYDLVKVINQSYNIDGDYEQCTRCLKTVIDADNKAKLMYEAFTSLLFSFDCKDRFSVQSDCAACKKAYHLWSCAAVVPWHASQSPVLPCQSFCMDIELRCPYMRPDVDSSYAGQPLFTCAETSGFGTVPNCYLPCHLVTSDPAKTAASDSTTSLSGCHEIPMNQSAANQASSAQALNPELFLLPTMLLFLLVTVALSS